MYVYKIRILDLLWCTSYIGSRNIASFPGLPRFRSSVCVQYNARQRKSAKKKWGRPGNTYHVNDVRWTRGGRGGGAVPDYKYGRNIPESDFLTGQAEYS